MADTFARRMNTQAAMTYVGAKRRSFTADWRPYLTPQKEGTSLVWDRAEIDRLCDKRLADARAKAAAGDAANDSEQNRAGNGRPEQKGRFQWAKNGTGSNPTKTAGGKLTNSSGALDFASAALKAKKRLKTG